MPVSGWRGPGRPPVDHRRAEPCLGGHFPEGLRAPLGAAGDRRPRQPDEIGRAAKRAAERGRSGDRDAALHSGHPARLEALHAVHVGRLAGRDRGPDAGRIAGVALAWLESCPCPLNRRRQRRQTSGGGELIEDPLVEAVDGDDAQAQARRHDGQGVARGCGPSRRAGRPREQERGGAKRERADGDGRAPRLTRRLSPRTCRPRNGLPLPPGSRQTRRPRRHGRAGR